MNNKKGFTLIELLAIIVILAVIMAIAIPQVLNVVNGSKESAWKDNIKMISKAIELNTQLYNVETGTYMYTIKSLCASPNKVNEISKSSDVTVECDNDVFTLIGIGQFDGFHAEINCSSGNCNSSTYAKGAYCDESVGHIWNFDYTGNEQKFIAPCQGTYKIEVWGAQGGSYNGLGGYGGYSNGNIQFNSSNSINVVVGGQGEFEALADQRGTDECNKFNLGGYNGGGRGTKGCNRSLTAGGGGGGGASHVASITGNLETIGVDNLDKIYIIAGGGGGGWYNSYTDGHIGKGGSGGGISGISGSYENTLSGGKASQTSGYLFGKGADAVTDQTDGGGGGGLYGGYADLDHNGTGWLSGGGGSGYIGHPKLNNKAMYCYGCEESSDNDTFTVSTTGASKLKDTTNCPDGYSNSAVSKCAKAGNGYARITYLGKN